MARKKNRRKGSRKTDKKNVAPALVREVMAIGLIALAILLLVAFVGAGGSLTASVLNLLRVVIGYTTFVLPLLFGYVAFRLFSYQEDESSGLSWFGILVLLSALAGLFQVMVDPERSLLVAQDGGGGGFVGYLIGRGLLSLLSKVSATILLVAVALIGLVLTLNVRISELFGALWGKWRAQPDEDLATQLEQAGAQAPKINAKVPLITSRGDADLEPVREEHVLTTSLDPGWTLPPLDLLEDKRGGADAGKPEENAKLIATTLANFGINVAVEEINIGPTVTQYALKPEGNVRLSKITELANNLELSLAAHPIRIEAPIPGKSAVGIEVPNRKAAVVRLKEILTSDSWTGNGTDLNFALGRDISGQARVADLATMPHLLIAGATGSGKSVMINALLLSLLYRHSPADLKLILVDPKRVELKLYENIPHLLSPIITDPEKCISALKWSVAEMERRYSLFAELGKRNIDEYNRANKESRMPFIAIVIDELADLMMMAPQDVETLIVRIAQKARATGIHLVIATQRPSVNVITGLIKANIPARIAFSTVSQVDSRTIIDQAGAEKLLGKGDMLFLAPDYIKPRRLQGVYVDDKEINAVSDFLRHAREPQYNEEVLTQAVKLHGAHTGSGDWDAGDDSLLMEAAKLVIESRKASASLLQRRLRVGYARAARLLDMLEERGIISAPDGARPRDVLVGSVSEVMGADDEETD
ncbi:DNA translocase FtsK 4TM domain-containing protein [Candidatus Microgenomates bacterium]|nr:DNA translocase FtsK 4TM domain-containing protein [Candidatus Microgenomates bacterium]